MGGVRKSFLETVIAVGPIVVIILLLQWIFAPMPPEHMARFLTGSVLLILGLTLFSHGVSVGMEPMGEEIGSGMTKSRKLWVTIVASFVVGFFVTMAEPDVQVLIGQVGVVSDGAISSTVMLVSIAVGVGITLVLATIRILLQWPMRYLLWIAYAAIFILAAFTPQEYVPIAFDSGGVTTGPMTVPFILAIGIGVASMRGDRNADEDSFGLVGLVSTGPIFAVLLLGVLSK